MTTQGTTWADLAEDLREALGTIGSVQTIRRDGRDVTRATWTDGPSVEALEDAAVAHGPARGGVSGMSACGGEHTLTFKDGTRVELRRDLSDTAVGTCVALDTVQGGCGACKGGARGSWERRVGNVRRLLGEDHPERLTSHPDAAELVTALGPERTRDLERCGALLGELLPRGSGGIEARIASAVHALCREGHLLGLQALELAVSEEREEDGPPAR